MKQTTNLKLNSLELNLDGKTLGRTYLEMFSGVGDNNNKRIDDFAGKTNDAITALKNSPATIFFNAKLQAGSTYEVTTSSVQIDAPDLITNGVYIVKLDSANSSEDVILRINGVLSKELRKVENGTDGAIVKLDVGDLPKGAEKLFRYNGQHLLLINSDALTIGNKQLSDLILKSEVVDSLTSTEATLPLSGNQGRALDEKIDTTNKVLVKAIDDKAVELTQSIEALDTELTANITATTDPLFNDFTYIYTPSTGVLSLTLMRKDGTNKIVDIDLPLELIIESGRYDSDLKTILLTLANGDIIKIPVQALVNEYFADNTSLTLYTDIEDGNKLKFKVKDLGVSREHLSTSLVGELDGKQPVGDYPTNEQMETAISDSVSNKVENTVFIEAMEGKADKSTTYTKSEIDTELALTNASVSLKADKSRLPLVVIITILDTSFVADATYPSYEYRAAISIEGLTADDSTDINLDVPSVLIANEAEVSSATNTEAGMVYIYSKSKPVGTMTGMAVITKGGE